jgi:hypothetical protein
LTAAGGLLAALVASSCCVLPLVLFSLGVSGAWIGNFTQLAPYQHCFIVATIGFLGTGYWLVFACRCHHERRLSLRAPELSAMLLESVITCPHCATAKSETMPTDACQFFYVCVGCGTTLRPKPGDCCVFCSFGSVPCPPIQAERSGELGAVSCCAG